MCKKKFSLIKYSFFKKKYFFNLLLFMFSFNLILFSINVKAESSFDVQNHDDDIFWNIFYLVFSQNPILTLDNALAEYKNENSNFVIPIIVKKYKNILEKIAFYDEGEIYNYLYSYTSNKDELLKSYVESLKELYLKKQSELKQFSDFVSKNYNKKVYVFYSLFKINNKDTEFHFSNFYFFSNNTDLKYIFYRINKYVIEDYLKKFSILPRLIILTKQDREYFQQMFLFQYQRERFEETIKNYLSDLLISKMEFIKFKNYSYLNDIENRLYFIKFTSFNEIFKKWDSLINSKDSIPYPRIFGNEVIKLIKDRKLKEGNLSDFIQIGLDNVTGVIYFPQFYENKKKDRKLKILLKDYLQNLYHIKVIDYKDYNVNRSKYFNKKILKIYFGNSKNNQFIKYDFNSEGDKNKFNFEIYSANNKEGGIFFNFNNMMSVIFLNYSDNSLYLRMFKDFKNIDKPYFVYKRNFFKLIIDKIVYFFNMLF